MARTVYVTTELTGGGSGLDGINGNSLVKGDMAFFVNKNTTGTARGHGFLGGVYVASSRGSTIAMGSTEDAPNFIKPDANGDNWIWGLTQPSVPVFHTTGKTAILPNYGVNVLRTTAATVHTLRRPRRGAMVKLVFASTQAIKIRLSSAAAAYTVKLDKVALVANSSACVIIAPTSRALTRTPPAIELVGRTTARWIITGLSIPTTGTVKGMLSYSTTT